MEMVIWCFMAGLQQVRDKELNVKGVAGLSVSPRELGLA